MLNPNPMLIPNFQKANFNGLKAHLVNYDWGHAIGDCSPKELYGKSYGKLLNIANVTYPLKKGSNWYRSNKMMGKQIKQNRTNILIMFYASILEKI